MGNDKVTKREKATVKHLFQLAEEFALKAAKFAKAGESAWALTFIRSAERVLEAAREVGNGQ